MTQRPAGFPVAAVRTTWSPAAASACSPAPRVPAPQTPPSARGTAPAGPGVPHLRGRRAERGPPSVTTYTSGGPPRRAVDLRPRRLDADAVPSPRPCRRRRRCTRPTSASSGPSTPAPGASPPSRPAARPDNDGTDLPIWRPGTAPCGATQGALDTAGASGWFQPRSAAASPHLPLQPALRQPGVPDLVLRLPSPCGNGLRPDDLPAGGCELFDPSGSMVATRTDDDGGYRFPCRRTTATGSRSVTGGLTSDAPLAPSTWGGDQTDVDFALRALSRARRAW